MLRKFSEELEQDREFEIGGELFKFRYPHWTEGAAILDGSLKEETDEDGQSNGEFSFKNDTEFAIKYFPMFLDPVNDSHKRFKALVARKIDPVPQHQIIQAYRWLVEVTGGFPTKPSTPSESGDGSNDTPSAEESS